MTKEYSVGGYAGRVHTRKNPMTGTQVSVYHSDQAGMDSSGGTKYHAVCEDHGMMIGERSIDRAKSAALDSASWCEECSKIYEERQKTRKDHFEMGANQ